MRYANSFDVSIAAEGMTTITLKYESKTLDTAGKIVETVERYEPIVMLTGFAEQMLAAWTKMNADSKKTPKEAWTPPVGETATNKARAKKALNR